MKDKATGKERLYMAVTKDRLSLPLAELARLRGAKRENILCSISRWKKGTVRCPGYIVVEVEDDLPF